jgi:catechol 2,3-dioxygenase-like lactoylglutathione lyase family enzyme
MNISAIDHVQIAMPAGGEDKARAFYVDLLGLSEVPKPPELAGRGGAWFQKGGVKLHLGIDPNFRPARKAHPALRVEDLPALVQRLEAAGRAVTQSQTPDGRSRAQAPDPFGNRLEFLSP